MLETPKTNRFTVFWQQESVEASETISRFSHQKKKRTKGCLEPSFGDSM